MIRISLALCLLYLVSCKEELLDLSKMTNEEIYFHDYEEPRHKWGYIDTTGKVVIKPTYDDVRDMIGKLTAVNLKGKWGYINKDNKQVIECKYQQVLDFSEEGTRAFVLDFDNQWLLIDNQGKTIKSLDFDSYKSFQGDNCLVSKNGAWGLINKQGVTLIPAQYLSLDQLDDCLLIAKKYDDYGIIDCNDEVIQDFKFQKIWKAGLNKLRVKDKENYYYTDYNLTNRSPNYQKTSLFEDGRAIVNLEGTIHIIDDNYQSIKTLDCDKIEHAGDRFFKYKKDGLWGLISPELEVISAAKFFLVNKYQEGYILYAEASDRWGYLDEQGEIFIPAELPIAWEYKNGFARVLHSKGCGFINKSKELVVDKRMFEVRDFYNGLARFQSFR